MYHTTLGQSEPTNQLTIQSIHRRVDEVSSCGHWSAAELLQETDVVGAVQSPQRDHWNL